MTGLSLLNVVSAFVTGFAPGVRPINLPTYRRLARERGRYAGHLAGYQPYLGNHEEPRDTPSLKRARLVFARIMAVEAERRAVVTAFLEGQGLTVAPEPAAWNAIGDWIAREVEGSREPGDDRYHPYVRDYVGGRPPSSVAGQSTTTLRPLWQSLSFDLSLLLGRHMLEVWPGGRWMLDADRPGREESRAGEPLVVYEDRPCLQSPFESVSVFLLDALLTRLRVKYEIGADPLGRVLRMAMDPSEDPQFPPEVSDAEAFIEGLRQVIADNDGVAPPAADIDEMLFEHGLENLPPLPPDLAKQIPPRPQKDQCD